MTKGFLLGAGLIGLTIAAPALPADIAASDTIIVTATRNEIRADDAIVPVRVITREDIELSMAADLAELLRFEAGIDIGRNGGPGQATSLFLNGSESNHTLVLVDGVRVNPGTIGGAAIQHVSPEIIERVEIVKGARSALFGTDAIGGVINIITRDARSSYVDAGISGGSFDSRSAHLSAGRAGDTARFGATVDWQQTDGFSPRVESTIDRGYDNLSLNLFGTRRFGSGEISLRHWRADGNVEYLDFFLTPADQDYTNSVTAAELDMPLTTRGTSKLIVAYMNDTIRQQQSPDFVESSRASVDWQYTHAFEQHTLTGGLYWVDERAESLSFGSAFDQDTDVRAVFVQDQMDFDRHRVFLAARLTDHEAFGDEITWNAEYAFDVSADWTLTAGVGRAFRAPDATDRFGFGGNPALEPEISLNRQLGVRYAPGDRHRFAVELYDNALDDLIEFDLATFTLVNVAEAELRSTELSYEFRGDTYTIRTELSHLDATDKATGARLLRRPERTARLRYTHNVGAHRVGLAVLASSERSDFGGVELDSYVVATLTAQLQLARHLQLNARVENLFDERYETAANFRMQERSTFVELRYGWQ